MTLHSRANVHTGSWEGFTFSNPSQLAMRSVKAHSDQLESTDPTKQCLKLTTSFSYLIVDAFL